MGANPHVANHLDYVTYVDNEKTKYHYHQPWYTLHDFDSPFDQLLAVSRCNIKSNNGLG